VDVARNLARDAATRHPVPPVPAGASVRASTLTGIAAEAGVSVSTVSKVLNGRTDVAPRTRDRIGELLRRHGYQPDSGQPSGIVDLLLGIGECPSPTFLHNPWADELLRGAVEAASEAQRSVAVTTVASPKEFDQWVELATARGTEGVLSVLHLPDGGELERLSAAGIPVVVIDPAEEPGPGIRSVGTTNWQGGLIATRHLVELGHRRIAAIGGEGAVWSSRARLDGYRAAMLDAGLPVDPGLVGRDSFTVSGGRRQTERLLSMADPPTGIVAGNDAQAFGVLQALAERGLRAPHDLSVVGFDDVPVASWAAPPLTTVRQPLAAMAATAFRMLQVSRSTTAAEAHHVELATNLVVRESTAPPAR
jgi:DNA-binding LacI/PurR family transcriptional regulator